MTERQVVAFIEKERQRQNIKTKDLCAAANLCIYSYYHWTEGRTAPRLFNILEFLHVLGYDMKIVKMDTPQRQPAREADGSSP